LRFRQRFFTIISRLIKVKRRNQTNVSAAAPPAHVAVIMDGNGRWARKRGLPRSAGHAAGAETFRRIATHCKNLGVKHLTVYAFSTENWKRPAEEIENIMDVLERYLTEAIGTMERDRVKMRFFGDTAMLSEKLRRLIAESEALSDSFDGVEVHLCVNYGGRSEIVRAAERLRSSNDEITAEAFEAQLYSAGIPDPDIIIRTGGETRLSNFLLWQSAYSELFFTDTLWPDFSERELDGIFAAFAARDRRYGGV